jgi:hypothetical protein
MPADDELTHHTWYAQQEHTDQIDKYEGSTAIRTRHIGKAPHIAQAYRRARRGKDNTQFGSEFWSFWMRHTVLL